MRQSLFSAGVRAASDPLPVSVAGSVRRDRVWVAAALLAIVALAACLRFAQLGDESYWLDEIIMVRLTGNDFETVTQEIAGTDRPPVYVLLSYAWARLFGTTEAAARSLSALAGVASIALMYLIGRELYRREIGLLASLIMAVSAFQVWYSQEHRYYAVLMLVILLAGLFYILWIKHRQRIDLIAYIGFAALAAYVHTYAIFFYVPLGLHFLLTQFRPQARLRGLWLISQVVLIAAIVPRLIVTFASLNAAVTNTETSIGGGTPVIDWLPVPPIYAPLRTLVNFLFIQRSYVSWTVIGIAAALLVIGVAFYALSRRSAWVADARQTARALLRPPDSNLLLVGLWLVCPIAIPFVLSYAFEPMFLDRFLIAAAPAWYLLIALALWAFRRVVPLALSVTVLLVLLGGVLWTYYTQDLKEQWRDTAAYIDQRVQPGDGIALSYGSFPGDAFNIRDSFSWYYPAMQSDCLVDVRSDSAAFTDQIGACGSHNERLWLVVYTSNPEGDPLTLTHLPERYPLVETQDFVGTTVYLFDLTP